MIKYCSSHALCCRSFSGSTQPPQQRELCNNPARKFASTLSGFRKKLRMFFSIWRRIHHQPNLQVWMISLSVSLWRWCFWQNGDSQCLCLPLSTCLYLFLFEGDVSGKNDSLSTYLCLPLSTCLCLFLFKGDVSGKGDSQSVYLSVSVSV